MNALFSTLTFMQPLILSGLLALPLLWYILRVTPPAPKSIFFPATRFLMGLTSEEQTPNASPWWLLLLRLLIAALIIIALARPVLNPAEQLPGNAAIRLVIDNGWAAAQSWNLQTKAAEEIISQAGRERREVYIQPTTTPLGEDMLAQFGPMTTAEAQSILRGLKPNPWPADYGALADLLEKKKARKSIHSIWLSHGLDEGNLKRLAAILQKQGGLSYITPSQEKLPLLLRPSAAPLLKKEMEQKGNTRIDVDAPKSMVNASPLTLKALGQGGDIIDVQNITLSPDALPQTVFFEILDGLRDKITRFAITGRQGAGAIFLLDDQFKRRKVGIVAPKTNDQSAPLIEESFYIRRALEPYADIETNTPLALVAQKTPVIILPDIAGMPTETLNTLEKWVDEGGLLLRFAGEHMADLRGDQFLLPVKLRNGERSFSGSLSWDQPQKIAPFTEDSPLYGLTIPNDISIKQQVLADPSQNLEGKVWARLTDGTPFITAKQQNKGLIVLIHTSANAGWSDFALSGLYVSTLKRIIYMAGQSQNANTTAHTALDPLLIMDGYGALLPPPASVSPLPAQGYDTIMPSAAHPPGLYGRGAVQYALNIGTNLPDLKIGTPDLPASVAIEVYEKEYEISMMPITLSIATILFCLDWLIMVIMAAGAWRFTSKAFSALLIMVCMMPIGAQASDESDMRYASSFYLAYIKTGDNDLDSVTTRGLESLAQTLTTRTSIEPAGVAALNPEIDNLAFFPLIYWAISDQHTNISDNAIRNIQRYLDQGGTILFDTRDQNRSISSQNNTDNARSLRHITASLNIPPIFPIPQDHVLGRAFYLLQDYPGRYSGGTLWVEQNSVSGRDNVSSVLIGSNDWAGSWAQSYGKAAMNRYRADYDARRQELSLRFGVNLVMYAMTGNYKADQVHIPHILERLGK